MKPSDFSSFDTNNILESLRSGEYYIWKVHFEDGTSQDVRITWDETSKEDLEKHFGKPITKIDYNFGIRGGQTTDDSAFLRQYHRDQNEIERRAGTRPWNAPVEEGHWVAKSKDGVEKRFKTSDTAGRDEWANKTVKAPAAPAAAAVPTKPSLTLDMVWRKVEEVVANIFPDGDPIDWLGPWLQKQGITDYKIGDTLDKAAQQNGYKDIYDYYDEMKRQYDADMTAEGSMGGINRSAPAQDVSYEDVLDEVYNAWFEEQELDELSTAKLRAYADKARAIDPHADRFKTVKHSQGMQKANARIASKTGDRRPTARTFEERLAEFLELDEAFDKNMFADILAQQDKEEKAAVQAKIGTRDIDHHGWTIRHQTKVPRGQAVKWQVMDKKDEIKHRGESADEASAITDAQNWINTKAGAGQEATQNVTIDFNVNFAKEIAPDFYATITQDNGVPTLLMSLEPQKGLRHTTTRQQAHKMTASTTPLPGITLSPKEANAAGLKPNGRYLLGPKEDLGDGLWSFPLIYQSTVAGKGDMVKMGKPGLTVAHNRTIEEENLSEFMDPWHGYSADDPKVNALKKAPKSSMQGTEDTPFSELVQDTIREHGLKWAFDFYVKKHGLPPRQFKIYAGL